MDHEGCGPVVAVSAIAVVLTVPVAQASDDKPTVLSTVMTGAAEVSGPGDPDGLRGCAHCGVSGGPSAANCTESRLRTHGWPGAQGLHPAGRV